MTVPEAIDALGKWGIDNFLLVVIVVGMVCTLVETIAAAAGFHQRPPRQHRTKADDAERELFLRTYQYKDRASNGESRKVSP